MKGKEETYLWKKIKTVKKHYHKEYRTKNRMARMVPKAATATHLQNEVGLCHQNLRYRWFNPQGLLGAALVFVKLNKASVNTPRTVKSYSAWEYPHLKPVNEMFYRHGYGKILKKCLAFTDNVLIARPLGKSGILHAGLNKI